MGACSRFLRGTIADAGFMMKSGQTLTSPPWDLSPAEIHSACVICERIQGASMGGRLRKSIWEESGPWTSVSLVISCPSSAFWG